MFMAERWQGQMTRAKEKLQDAALGPGVETKPKGRCLTPCMPTEQKTWLFAHLLSITKTKSRPLTGCDLDRWIARHVLFVAEKVRQQCEIFTTGFEIVTQALTASVYRLIKKCEHQRVDLGYRNGKKTTIYTTIGKLWLHHCDSAINENVGNVQ